MGPLLKIWFQFLSEHISRFLSIVEVYSCIFASLFILWSFLSIYSSKLLQISLRQLYLIRFLPEFPVSHMMATLISMKSGSGSKRMSSFSASLIYSVDCPAIILLYFSINISYVVMVNCDIYYSQQSLYINSHTKHIEIISQIFNF